MSVSSNFKSRGLIIFLLRSDVSFFSSIIFSFRFLFFLSFFRSILNFFLFIFFVWDKARQALVVTAEGISFSLDPFSFVYFLFQARKLFLKGVGTITPNWNWHRCSFIINTFLRCYIINYKTARPRRGDDFIYRSILWFCTYIELIGPWHWYGFVYSLFL